MPADPFPSFTPGPLTVHENKRSITIAAHRPDGIVTTASVPLSEFAPAAARQRADAALYAAAPALYAACLTAYEAFTDEELIHFVDTTPVLRVLRAALAAARPDSAGPGRVS